MDVVDSPEQRDKLISYQDRVFDNNDVQGNSNSGQCLTVPFRIGLP
jgi:hypothetical protein